MLGIDELVALLNDVPRSRDALRVLVDDGLVTRLGDRVGLSRAAVRFDRVLELAPHVPALVWGRDELGAGEMWNSNSVVSWLLARSGVDTGSIRPPAGGRATGWDAGLMVACDGVSQPQRVR